jgi:DNA-binding NtrC family response regulator
MNAIAAAFTYGKGDRIQFADLPPEVRGDSKVGVGGMAPPSNPAARASVPTFEESERQLLHRALDATHGNKVRAAKMLGISRKQLYAKLAKYAIDVERMGAEP